MAEAAGLGPGAWLPFGANRAKVDPRAAEHEQRSRPLYVLVTGTSPTQSGEGKTVTTIGVTMAFCRKGRRAVATLRQSSLGPTLGLKGGGAGGGAASLVPLDDALLGLGSDLFAVESANNLLAARVDDVLDRPLPDVAPLDPASISWRRVVDVDDRALRHVLVHPDGKQAGVGRASGFDITAASEVMAVLSLATDLADLRARLARIVVGADVAGEPVTAAALGAAGAIAALLRDAFWPNLLQTSEGTPVLVHGGPFANIAHGCSSVIADRVALATADVVVTEAGFGADLGAEKFLHLKVPVLGRAPDVAVIVTTVRALREHGERLGAEGPDPEVVSAGAANLRHHVGLMRSFGLPVVVAVNRFDSDTDACLAVVEREALAAGATAVAAHRAFVAGGAGAEELAAAIEAAAASGAEPFAPLVTPALGIRTYLETIAASAYGAGSVAWEGAAEEQLAWLERAGFGRLPVCVAKTHRSISHDAQLAGAPRGFTLPVKELRLRAGAGFVTAYAGPIVTMPGLPSRPRFLDVDLAADGTITGLV